MAFLIPVQYHRKEYPNDIKPKITEVAGHFDKEHLNLNGAYSLHTEYSFGRRKFNSNLVRNFKTICQANQNGVPMLWYSREWAEEFAEFIIILTKGDPPPTIIEIHPPFSDYSNLKAFFDFYMVFERKIKENFPDVICLMENRDGTIYRGGKFIFSEINQIVELSRELDKKPVELKITLDIIQLFSAHQISKKNIELMSELFEEIKKIRHNILGIHLWGKKDGKNNRRDTHVGDLNSYFRGDMQIKEEFLKSMAETFNDDIKRFFVPEVNSESRDLQSIVADLKKVGFKFL